MLSRFSAAVEKVARTWDNEPVTPVPWEIVAGDPERDRGHVGSGEAHGLLVAAGPLLGFAKTGDSDSMPRAANEKLAADLAFDLGLPVPPCTLWEHGERVYSVSLLAFQPPLTWGKALDKFGVLPLHSLEVTAYSMQVFDTWVDNIDRVNYNNLVIDYEGGDRIERAAYIDYAFSLGYRCGWRSKAYSRLTLQSPFPWGVRLTPAALEAAESTLRAIERISDDSLAETVLRLPKLALSYSRRMFILDGLRFRRDNLRQACADYWRRYAEQPLIVAPRPPVSCLIQEGCPL